MKRVSVFFFVLLMVAGISGCETAKGFGKDLGKLGDSIEDAASK